jgi:hypothetical protein
MITRTAKYWPQSAASGLASPLRVLPSKTEQLPRIALPLSVAPKESVCGATRITLRAGPAPISAMKTARLYTTNEIPLCGTASINASTN